MGTQLFIDGDVLAGVVLHGPELADVLVGAHLVGAAAGGVQDVGGANGSVGAEQDHIQGVTVLILVSNHDHTASVARCTLHAAHGIDGVDIIGIIIHAEVLSVLVHIEGLAATAADDGGGELGVVHSQSILQIGVQLTTITEAIDGIVSVPVPSSGNVIIKGIQAIDNSKLICLFIINESLQCIVRISFIQLDVRGRTIRQGHGLGVPGKLVGIVTALLAVNAGHIVHVVQVRTSGALHTDDIAVGGQVDGVFLVEVEVAGDAVHETSGAVLVAGKLILGAVHGDGLVLTESGDFAGDSLGLVRSQDFIAELAVAEGHGQNSALVIGGGIAPQGLLGIVVLVVVVVAVVAVQIGEGQDLGGAVAALSGADVGIDLVDLGNSVAGNHNGLHIAVVILVSLDDIAHGNQLRGLHLIVIAVQEVLGILGFGAAVIHVAGAGDHLADVHIVVLHHISGVSLVGIGAHIVAIIDPLAGGTAEDVGVVLLLQVLEILLAELHQAVAVALAIDVAVGVGIVFHVLAGGSGVDGDVAHNDGVLLVILDHGGLQHVEGVQGGLLTGHSLGAHELVVAVVQTDAAGLLDDADLPVGAGVALDGAVIAQSAQQHLHERVAAQGAGGTEGAVSIAADDTLLRAVGDVAREGVGHGNILEGGGAGRQSRCSGGAQDQVADDLGGRATGQDIIGTEVAVGITVDNTQGRDHIHSFFVGDLAVVREVLGAGADGDQRHGHHQSKHQRKELLHWDFSSFKKFAVRRKTPGGSGIRVGASQPTCVGLHQPQSRMRGASAVRKANLREKTAGVQRFANLLIQLKNGEQTAWTAMSRHHNTDAISAPAAARAKKESGP